MVVNNNYQPSFKSIKYNYLYSESKEKQIKDILYSKLPKADVDSFLKRLENSPVKTTLGLADGEKFDRLDATVEYRHPNTSLESFAYFAENKFLNLLTIKPINFINKILMKIESIEETFQIGRYAK